MKILSHILSFAVIVFLLAGCEKKELAVPKHDPGSIITSTVEMDPTYKWQVYFNLKKNTVTGKNLKTTWDLGFEATAAGYHIILNSAKSMYALNTGKTGIASVSYADTTGFYDNKRWDSPDGYPDSTAIGDWRIDNSVYIIDRGYNELGQSLGLQKIQVVEVNDSTYTIRFGALGSAGFTTIKIKKDSAYNFTFLSFDNSGEIIKAEPPRDEWDIVFTQYTHIFYNPLQQYLVTGCLLNRYRTSAYMDSSVGFAQLAYNDVSSARLSSDINIIGYGWKGFTGSSYITYTKLNYIIRDQNGLYYKLHFTDFYSISGTKGNPKWEYQQL